jgi:hypothetical protein
MDEDVLAQIAKSEAQARRYRNASLGSFLGILALVTSNLLSDPEFELPEVIQAREFVLVDKHGLARARLHTVEEHAAMGQLIIYGGHTPAAFRGQPTGQVVISGGTGEKPVGLEVYRPGNADAIDLLAMPNANILRIYDPDGASSALLYAQEEETALQIHLGGNEETRISASITEDRAGVYVLDPSGVQDEMSLSQGKRKTSSMPSTTRTSSPNTRTSSTNTRTSSTNTVESVLDSIFTGFGPGTTFVLSNGQIWEQTSKESSDTIRVEPAVTIWKSDADWKLRVEGSAQSVTVKRLK